VTISKAGRLKRFVRVVAVVVMLGVVAIPGWAGDVNGAWTGQLVTGQVHNAHAMLLNLKAEGAVLTGTIAFCKGDCTSTGKAIPIENGKVGGDTISFSFPTGAPDVPQMDLQGTVNGDSIQFVVSGNAQDCMSDACQIGTGTATRVK
jgi:hypothetical protein